MLLEGEQLIVKKGCTTKSKQALFDWQTYFSKDNATLSS